MRLCMSIKQIYLYMSIYSDNIIYIYYIYVYDLIIHIIEIFNIICFS